MACCLKNFLPAKFWFRKIFQSIISAGVCFCRSSRHNCVMDGIVKNTKNRRFYSSRLRFAGRPSFRRREGKEKENEKPSFRAAKRGSRIPIYRDGVSKMSVLQGCRSITLFGGNRLYRLFFNYFISCFVARLLGFGNHKA